MSKYCRQRRVARKGWLLRTGCHYLAQERQRERQTERERDRGRERDRERQRETEGDRERQMPINSTRTDLL